jgi:hypothetical protein
MGDVGLVHKAKEDRMEDISFFIVYDKPLQTFLLWYSPLPLRRRGCLQSGSAIV